MIKNNLVKVLVVVLSMGIMGIYARLISIEREKKNQDASVIIDNFQSEIGNIVEVELPKKEPTTERTVIDEPPIEKDPIAETPKDEKPLKKDPPKKDPIKKETPVKKDDDKVIVSPKYITKDEAIAIGLKKVGIGAILVEIDVELDDNPPKYELEIILGNYEYELEIHAITGAIIDFDKDEID